VAPNTAPSGAIHIGPLWGLFKYPLLGNDQLAKGDFSGVWD